MQNYSMIYAVMTTHLSYVCCDPQDHRLPLTAISERCVPTRLWNYGRKYLRKHFLPRQGCTCYAHSSFSQRIAAVSLLLFVFQIHWLEFQSHLVVLFNTFLKDSLVRSSNSTFSVTFLHVEIMKDAVLSIKCHNVID